MGLPYEDKLQEMIEEEDGMFQRELPDISPLSVYHVIFKGVKYTITGAAFIRSIEPFNQELCDLLFQAEKTAVSLHPLGGIGAEEMIFEATARYGIQSDPDFFDAEDEA
jgi:hypothetical protein